MKQIKIHFNIIKIYVGEIMELKYLNTFHTIVKEGGFRQAAEKLNYTQSTITFQIGQLEKELSVALFEKVGRRMVLTSAGKALIPYADKVLDAVEQIPRFQDELSEYGGELRVGVAESYLCYKLPSYLKNIVKEAPKAKFIIQSMNCYEIRDKLDKGDLDIGIFYQDVGGNLNNLKLDILETTPVSMVVSPVLADQVREFTKKHMDYPFPFIINEKNCIFRQIFEQYLSEQEISLSHTIQLESIETIKRLVQNDMGITFLPRFTVEEELQNGNLVEVKTDVKHNEITLVMGYNKNKWISPLMELFMEQIRENNIQQ